MIDVWSSYLAGAREKLERKRIKIHLKKVEEDLRDKKNTETRKRTLGNLREYRKRGIFPKNPDFLGREPFFTGPNGTLCAVGYLLDKSGYENLVEEITENTNNVYLENVEDDRILSSIQGLGLEKEEAERIQPGYSTTTHTLLASNCGPLSCEIALAAISLVGTGAFLSMEYIAYNYISSLYPEKPLKKYGSFTGISVMTGLITLTSVLTLYAFLP